MVVRRAKRSLPASQGVSRNASITLDVAIPQADGSVVQERPTFNDFDKAIAWLTARKPKALKELKRG